MGRHGRPRVGRHQFTSETKRNALFEEYYKGQSIVPENEYPDFMRFLQEDLPITFRVTGFREQNRELLQFIKNKFTDNISGITVPNSDENQGDSQNRINFASLPWYPEELAWQLDTNRYVVRKNEHLKDLHRFLVSEMESGNISRQEAVSMLPPLVMGVRSHHAVLDLCAAPGSKSAQLVELLHADAELDSSKGKSASSWPYVEPTGLVVANDVDQKRCYMMVHQVKRLQSPCTLITQEDATCFPKLYTPKLDSESEKSETEQFLFDRILTDVPCSGDGTLRKNPDLWLRWSPNLGIAQHYLQLRILRRGLEMLRDKCSTKDSDYGRLVYSTCSFNPLEDEAVVASMLHACQGSVRLVDPETLPSVTYSKTNSGRFRVRPGLTTWRVMNKKGQWFDTFQDVPEGQQSNIRPSLFPPENASELHLDRCMRVLPHDQNTGGFFLAVLEKVAPLPWMKASKRSNAEQPSETSNISSGSTANSDSKTVNNPTEPIAVKRTHEAGSISFQDEPKKPRVFNENPFTYVDPSVDNEWNGIRDYYGLSEDLNIHDCSPPKDRKFPPCRLLYRSTKEELRRRQFYYTNGLVKRLIQSNIDRGLKIVSSGVRFFAIMEDKQFNGYRLLQDGVDLADAFLPVKGGRRIDLSPDQYPDLVLLLQEEMPLLNRMSNHTQEQCAAMDPGPVLIVYTPDGASSSLKNPTDGDPPRCRLMFAGWRGLKSLRHYVGRFERHHLMRLANLAPTPMVMGRNTSHPSPDSAVTVDPSAMEPSSEES